MTDAALLDAVRLAVRAEVEPLRRALERLAPPPLSPAQAALLDAIAEAVDWPFTARELLELRRSAIAERRRLDAALQALGVVGDDDRAVHKLGMKLGAIVKRSALLDVRLVRAGDEDHSGLWAIERGPPPA